jgi:hypothetical protein
VKESGVLLPSGAAFGKARGSVDEFGAVVKALFRSLVGSPFYFFGNISEFSLYNKLARDVCV